MKEGNVMNKNDLAKVKKEFKLNSVGIKFKELYTVYLKKDNQKILHQEKGYFDSMGEGKQELLMKNFKKIISGALNTKLFELNFAAGQRDGASDKELYTALQAEDYTEFAVELDKIIDKIGRASRYETDIVINFLRCEAYIGAKKKKSRKKKGETDDTADEEENIPVQTYEFIVASINKVEVPKINLIFDFKGKEIRTNEDRDIIINTKAPLDGFLYPAFEDGFANVNKIMYYTSKTKDMNTNIITDVLGCELVLTAEEEKNKFLTILNTVAGGKIKPAIMKNIYERIYDDARDDEDTPGEQKTLTYKQLNYILGKSGLELKKDLDEAYNDVLSTTKYEFKVDNILPKFSTKSITIGNDRTNISITPEDLDSVKQIRDEHGNKCLVIQMADDVYVNGFELEIEAKEE